MPNSFVDKAIIIFISMIIIILAFIIQICFCLFSSNQLNTASDFFFKKPPIAIATGLGDKESYFRNSIWTDYNSNNIESGRFGFGTKRQNGCDLRVRVIGVRRRIINIEGDTIGCFTSDPNEYPTKEVFMERIKLMLPTDSRVKFAFTNNDNLEIYEFDSRLISNMAEISKIVYKNNNYHSYHLFINYNAQKVPVNFSISIGSFGEGLGFRGTTTSPFRRELFSQKLLEKTFKEEKLSRGLKI